MFILQFHFCGVVHSKSITDLNLSPCSIITNLAGRVLWNTNDNSRTFLITHTDLQIPLFQPQYYTPTIRMLQGKTKLALCGGITSRIHKCWLLWLTVMIVKEWMSWERKFGVWRRRTSSVVYQC